MSRFEQSSSEALEQDFDDMSSRKVLLKQYEKHREEVQLIMKLQDKLFMRSITAIGAIIGYSFYRSNNIILISVIPFAIGLFFIRHLSLSRGIVRVAGHLRQIEEQFDIDGFDWETNHGATSESASVYSIGPAVALYLVVTVLYFGAILSSILVIRTSSLTLLGYEIGVLIASIGYTILTTVLLLVATSSFMSIRQMREQFIRNNDEDDATLIDTGLHDVVNRTRTHLGRLNSSQAHHLVSRIPIIGRLFQDANQIESGMYIGNASAAAATRDGDFDRVFSVAENLTVPATTDSYELDAHLTDQRDEFKAAVDSLRSATQSGDSIMIHCHEGRERAPTVLATALAAERGKSFEQQLRLIENERSIVNPTPELKRLAKEYLNEASR